MRWCFVVMALGAPAGLTAQGDPVVAPGSRVRIHLVKASGGFDAGVDGTIERLAGDTVTLRPRSGGAALVFPSTSGGQLYVFMGRRTFHMRGIAIGGLAGLVGGGFVGAVAGRNCVGADGVVCSQRRQVALTSSLILGACGAVIGFVAGTIASHDVWAPSRWIPPGTLDLSLRPNALALGVSFAF